MVDAEGTEQAFEARSIGSAKRISQQRSSAICPSHEISHLRDSSNCRDADFSGLIQSHFPQRRFAGMPLSQRSRPPPSIGT